MYCTEVLFRSVILMCILLQLLCWKICCHRLHFLQLEREKVRSLLQAVWSRNANGAPYPVEIQHQLVLPQKPSQKRKVPPKKPGNQDVTLSESTGESTSVKVFLKYGFPYTAGYVWLKRWLANSFHIFYLRTLRACTAPRTRAKRTLLDLTIMWVKNENSKKKLYFTPSH